MAKMTDDAPERLAKARANAAKAKVAADRKKVETSYKLPGGGTKYDTPGTKNGFNPGKGFGKKGYYD